MTDIQHNISDDFIIQNTTDIGNDYKFSTHKTWPSRPSSLSGMVLFRLLAPGPSNLRGRTEAYQVSISTNSATGAPSTVANSQKSAIISKPSAPITSDYAHIDDITDDTAEIGNYEGTSESYNQDTLPSNNEDADSGDFGDMGGGGSGGGGY